MTRGGIAERGEQQLEAYRYSMGVGTHGSVLPEEFKRPSEFKYLSVPRVAAVNEPTISLLLEANDSWGATQLMLLLSSALTRTQGPVPDQFRVYLGPVAGRLGRPVERPAPSVSEAVRTLKERTGLPASEVAQMLGVRRRQLYKIAESGSTSPEREARIRAINDVVDELYARFGDAATVRSCLLAPIAGDLRSFVDFASEGDVRAAREALSAYLESRGARGIPTYIERPRKSERRQEDAGAFVRSTRDIVPGR